MEQEITLRTVLEAHNKQMATRVFPGVGVIASVLRARQDLSAKSATAVERKWLAYVEKNSAAMLQMLRNIEIQINRLQVSGNDEKIVSVAKARMQNMSDRIMEFAAMAKTIPK